MSKAKTANVTERRADTLDLKPCCLAGGCAFNYLLILYCVLISSLFIWQAPAYKTTDKQHSKHIQKNNRHSGQMVLTISSVLQLSDF